ncbi:MAG: pyruvate, phosphate dikinase [Rhodobacterales bacterium]|nr:MAG: pyruvate, phosphate dikinase [Rhodobacterales bacterium]
MPNRQKASAVPQQDFTEITLDADITTQTHGGRAKCLQRLIRLGMPVPKTLAVSFDVVHAIANGQLADTAAMMRQFGSGLVCVRPSSQDPDWGGPGAILNIGMNDKRHAELTRQLGEEAANALYLRFIQAYAVHVARLDPDMFELPAHPGNSALKAALHNYEEETDKGFPQDPAQQLAGVLSSMARAWEGTSARLLRQAKGAPVDAGLGLVVQEMALGVGAGKSGSGVIQFVDGITGQPQITGRYLCQSQGRDALLQGHGALYLQKDARGASLQDALPVPYAELLKYGTLCRSRLREEMQIEFTVSNEVLSILDAVRLPRRARAAVRIAVALAEDGIISKEEALRRIEPRALSELLHHQINPEGARDVFQTGIAASPGAACGRIVFSSNAAQASAARGEACILVREETTPEDVRGMHASVAVLTMRGGVSSHAAVIARGLGLPCVVGAMDMKIDRRAKTLTAADGREFKEGDMISIDGTLGQALAGCCDMLEPALDGAFTTLMGWAGEVCDIGVRANADTPADARIARKFNAEGIGLCRTEHMFFESSRLTVMREMIFSDSSTERAAALQRLLPMQRQDFLELFEIMEGKPVCIRLLDPPLHEFLPTHREGQRALAEALDLPVSAVTRRVDALREYNPMLGMRGVRLGITVPEIYDMQARAIFEATLAARQKGIDVVPEVMLPLISATREVELVKSRVDAVAAEVRIEMGQEFDYRLGVMVETPRAALRAGDIAQNAAFLSFGTNDLTQMTYGLSRDDAGRFMSNYVQLGVCPEDPFHTLDTEGVGELLSIGAARGRAVQPDLVLSICGEHGGNPESIEFCRNAGYDYVSCSPYRVPVARLAAAHLAILEKVTES